MRLLAGLRYCHPQFNSCSYRIVYRSGCYLDRRRHCRLPVADLVPHRQHNYDPQARGRGSTDTGLWKLSQQLADKSEPIVTMSLCFVMPS